MKNFTVLPPFYLAFVFFDVVLYGLIEFMTHQRPGSKRWNVHEFQHDYKAYHLKGDP